MLKKFGSSTCPNCGPIALIDPEKCRIYMPQGLVSPMMMIECSVCNQPFIAKLKWEDAYKFDSLGCEVIGFSRRTSEPATEDDIVEFMNDFDKHHYRFLDIIEAESDL